MTKFEEVLAPGITIRESANDGSDFTNPTADYRRLFLGEDGQLHVKDSSGTVTDIGAGSGNVATDAIWDAAGDLAVGSGANTAAKLSIGATNGMVLARVSGAVAWALPPGYEFAYAEITADVTTTSTSPADATGLSVSYTADGGAVMVEFWTGELRTTGSAGGDTRAAAYLYDTTGTASIAQGFTSSHNSGNQAESLYLRRKITPSAGTQAYKVQYQTVAAGTATIRASATNPAYIRVTKV